MDFIMEKGDKVIYNGEIHLRDYLIWKNFFYKISSDISKDIWESLYNHLKKGEFYEIKEITTSADGYIYYRLGKKDWDAWYPKESFFVDKREYISKKYKLK